MDSFQAQHIIESLRLGIPPEGYVRQFTVGRTKEIEDLIKRLQVHNETAVLLMANYGSGKTHLLKYIREESLERNYAVSTVTIDSNSGVRFNRMDQIFGAVCRNIEIPQSPGQKGLRSFFNFLVGEINKKNDESIWQEISNNWKWDYSEVLNSPAIFIGIRAWATGNDKAADIVEDWFFQPWQYKAKLKKLYTQLIENLRPFFRDPRPDWKFYTDQVFTFDSNGYSQSWAALSDLNILALYSDLNGLIILFDEFEDVITNLKNVAHQEAAFWNLFHFYSGKKYFGKTFYAVTPAFVEKCKNILLNKGRWDFDFSLFDKLPTYEMSPLTTEHLYELAMRILETHGIAYNWEPDLEMKASQLLKIINAASLQTQDRARHIIKSVVKALDDLYQESP
ncbi:MAG: DUF2791 family P-loop domain-containing protein [Candidatus Atribacteria bacterium]|jgi:hypothetical protein|nr:DUF2791 family P-loop domain-containing protein [Candidatus Atribacteria bacterium]